MTNNTGKLHQHYTSLNQVPLSGGIYVLKRGTVFNESPSDKKIGHIEIDEKASLNINEEIALEIAEIFLKNEKV